MLAGNKLTKWILIALLLGIGAGFALNRFSSDTAAWADFLSLFTTVFLRLIKMVIAPLVFATLVVGIAKMGDVNSVGRIGLKAIAWFVAASLVSLTLGLVLVNLFQPGVGITIALPDAGAAAACRPAPSRCRNSSRTWCPPASSMAWRATRSCRSWCSRCSSASPAPASGRQGQRAGGCARGPVLRDAEGHHAGDVVRADRRVRGRDRRPWPRVASR